MNTLIRNARLVNEGRITEADVYIEGALIHTIGPGLTKIADRTIDARGQFLLPGLIDDQVHFREPGLTAKGDLTTESRAAVAGGVTSYMEMPNTKPAAVTQELLAQKYDRAAQVSAANYSFFIGATNDNLDQLLATDPKQVCGVKIFMGSSTGDLLVDDPAALEAIFAQVPLLIATHCEFEPTVRADTARLQAQYGDTATAALHPQVRSRQACLQSSTQAIELATRHGSRLHILHISTADEVALFRNDIPRTQKRITAEACVHHLWFCDQDYERLGNRIKWNPAVKTAADRDAIWQALLDGRIDVIATDHAPHTIGEKALPYWQAPSGGPLVQHSLLALYEAHTQGRISLELIADRAAHAAADLFQIDRRGYIREGYFADLVLLDPTQTTTVRANNLLYKCGWSPFEGHTFPAAVTHTFVNGHLAYSNGQVDGKLAGKRLTFNR